MKILPVPYVNQTDSEADELLNDCGIACVAMMAGANGQSVTVDEMVLEDPGEPIIPDSDALISVETIRLLAGAYQMPSATKTDIAQSELVNFIAEGRLPILLVDYGVMADLDLTWKQARFGHFVLAVGYDSGGLIYHDPYFEEEDGGFRYMTWAQLEAVWASYQIGSSGNYYNAAAIVPDASVIKEEETMTNLLKNGSFEGDYYAVDSMGDIKIPLNWQYFNFGSQKGIHCEAAFEPQFVEEGEHSFRLYTSYRVHNWVGIRQLVQGLETGALYRLHVRVHARPRNEGDGLESSGMLSPWIGVDLNADITPQAASVIKQSWDPSIENAKYDEFRDFEIEFRPTQSSVMVFFWSEAFWPIFRNEVFFEAASLQKVGDSIDPGDPTDPPVDPPSGECDLTEVLTALDELKQGQQDIKDQIAALDCSGGGVPVEPPVEPPQPPEPTHKTKVNLNLRNVPGGSVLLTMPSGDDVAWTGQSLPSGGYLWYEVYYGTTLGWCASEYLSPLV